MSSDLAISVRGLSKEYIITHEEKFTTLGEKMMARLKHPLRRPQKERFRALEGVSFDVHKGDVLGIIGRNGAGKSTLLKIFSRITEPTSGEVSLHGRVASLLEVGTGFHPELTGRENIYLNGAILGMKRAEIRKHFDAIVEFAEIERFLDTPVKRFSSGMYVRLAFAVAAHLEPEILVVDEVLAVGDAEFQKKCLGKMHEVSQNQGRTVLFVSHQMAAVRSLCTRLCVLAAGKVSHIGSLEVGISAYLNYVAQTESKISGLSRPPGAACWITGASICTKATGSSAFHLGDDLMLLVQFEADPPIRDPRIGFVISSADGQALLNANNRYQTCVMENGSFSKGRVECDLGAIPLMPGRYFISLYFGHHTQDTCVLERAIAIDILEKDIWGRGHTPPDRVSVLWWPTGFRILNDEGSLP